MMLNELVSELRKSRLYKTNIGRYHIKFELRQLPCSRNLFSILTSESGNPVGYLDAGPENGQQSCVECAKGYLSFNGFVLDGKIHYHEGYDDVNGGFKDSSNTWGFFVNEQYRRCGIGMNMLSIALEVARQLSQENRPLQPNEAYFMVWRPRSPFYSRYVLGENCGLKPGIGKNDADYDCTDAALLFFSDFEIPNVRGEEVS